ncbi:aldehyde dehydrogenase family protein, partial [Oceanospirillaceae bacterium]|nr:aldehyde dehydrogenase family protein [Oceanospirillaceae bacterium]
MKSKSYACGVWVEGEPNGAAVHHPVTGELICTVSSAGVNFENMAQYARNVGGAGLGQMTIHERANAIKDVAKHLLTQKDHLYKISSKTGATKLDSWIDIEGGLATMFSYSGIARREFANEKFIVEGPPEPLSANGSFVGRHILTS